MVVIHRYWAPPSIPGQPCDSVALRWSSFGISQNPLLALHLFLIGMVRFIQSAFGLLQVLEKPGPWCWRYLVLNWQCSHSGAFLVFAWLVSPLRSSFLCTIVDPSCLPPCELGWCSVLLFGLQMLQPTFCWVFLILNFEFDHQESNAAFPMYAFQKQRRLYSQRVYPENQAGRRSQRILDWVHIAFGNYISWKLPRIFTLVTFEVLSVLVIMSSEHIAHPLSSWWCPSSEVLFFHLLSWCRKRTSWSRAGKISVAGCRYGSWNLLGRGFGLGSSVIG